MAGTGYGHGGAVQAILDAIPTDSTFHVMDCGYDDNEGRCGCYDLPSQLRRIVEAAQAEAWDAGAQAATDWIKSGAWLAAMPVNPHHAAEVVTSPGSTRSDAS